ncbi:MAG: undecaprenyl-diphosphate phosphatase [Duodenibacillus sp.]|nr:undecaprenyl-diphosphate phosphatase [Duodenibacillus sp.]HBC69065.1 undecaprenyl-diphosphatase [Sutterella sp.]
MDFVYIIQAVILGIVEGLTEFLPVSSTGHLILAGDIIRYDEVGAETFYVAIQAGAILAVCWHYRDRIVAILKNLFKPGKDQRLAVNTVIAFLPAAVIGVFCASAIKMYLFKPVPVAAALVIGGLIILWIENVNVKSARAPRVAAMDDMDWKDALAVGFMQCFALIPGTSRSGATIIGGLVLGLSRKAATEFSFFLSIPTIFGATVYDLWKSRDILTAANLPSITVGFVVSFISAIFVVRWLLRFVSTNNFKGFGWYRICFGLVVLIACYSGLMTM